MNKRIKVSATALEELKKLRGETHTHSYSSTIEWLLEHREQTLDLDVLDSVKEIMADNNYKSISATVQGLIDELLDCMDKEERNEKR